MLLESHSRFDKLKAFEEKNLFRREFLKVGNYKIRNKNEYNTDMILVKISFTIIDLLP